jgi:hypothetical protein
MRRMEEREKEIKPALSCVLLKRVPQGRTESGGIVLAANAGPRVPSGGVTLKRRCTYRPSVIYLIVNKILSLSLSLSPPHLGVSHAPSQVSIPSWNSFSDKLSFTVP